MIYGFYMLLSQWLFNINSKLVHLIMKDPVYEL